ncbi:MAG: serine--tRNA ligase, partial [Clostridia bacterium]|nr:serine--tRNA ligase [Clostridia bacterium]
MLDINFLRKNPDAVKANIRAKFQDRKLPLVDQVIELDNERRKIIADVEALKAARNRLSKANGPLYGRLKGAKSEEEKAELQKQIDANNQAVKDNADEVERLDGRLEELDGKIREIMLVIPNIIDPSVPIGKDDSENVEVQKYGDPVVPDFEIPYHTDIMARFGGIDLDAARRVAGNGFYYLIGDIARLHSAVLTYARDFMINRGFTYVIPPYMIRSGIVDGVMSFAEMDAMMYKIEGEDLFLIGTSEHSMIGRFVDQIIPEEQLPLTLTSYSPCFRKE